LSKQSHIMRKINQITKLNIRVKLVIKSKIIYEICYVHCFLICLSYFFFNLDRSSNLTHVNKHVETNLKVIYRIPESLNIITIFVRHTLRKCKKNKTALFILCISYRILIFYESQA